LVAKAEGKRALGRPRQDGRIIMKWVSRKYCGRMWTRFV
jgi:hypothetical protein